MYGKHTPWVHITQWIYIREYILKYLSSVNLMSRTINTGHKSLLPHIISPRPILIHGLWSWVKIVLITRIASPSDPNPRILVMGHRLSHNMEYFLPDDSNPRIIGHGSWYTLNIICLPCYSSIGVSNLGYTWIWVIHKYVSGSVSQCDYSHQTPYNHITINIGLIS